MSRRSINLTFHGIGRPGRRLDPHEDVVWVSQDRFLSVLDEVADRRDVAISFDDGNESDVELALPALCERGLHATFFVVAGRLGQPAFVDEAGVRALAAAGMEIGCHGMRHRAWRGLDRPALREELVDARHVLERAVRRPVTRASCPFGAYDRRVLRALHRCGYASVYTSDRGTARPNSFLQTRNTIGPHDGDELLDRIRALDRRPSRHAKGIVKRWR